MHNGLVLIVVACPCALIISTPVTYVAGLAATAQRGILIKGGAHLEALGLLKTICFGEFIMSPVKLSFFRCLTSYFLAHSNRQNWNFDPRQLCFAVDHSNWD